MHALGMIGNRIFHNNLSLSRLARLKNLDFSRSNSRLLKQYTINNKLANNPNVRRNIRDYLWVNILKYANLND